MTIEQCQKRAEAAAQRCRRAANRICARAAYQRATAIQREPWRAWWWN